MTILTYVELCCSQPKRKVVENLITLATVFFSFSFFWPGRIVGDPRFMGMDEIHFYPYISTNSQTSNCHIFVFVFFCLAQYLQQIPR